MKRNERLIISVGLALALGAGASALSTSVPAVYNGLGTTAMVNKNGGGMVTIGLRGADASGTDPVINTRTARIGFIEVDSDDRRMTTVAGTMYQAQNGLNTGHTSLSNAFSHVASARDFAPDGMSAPASFNPAVGVQIFGSTHGTGVAGVALSRHNTNRGVASRAIGYMALCDDAYSNGLDLTTRSAWSQLEMAGDWLAITQPQVCVINGSWGFTYKQAATPSGYAATVRSDLNGSSFASKLNDWYAWNRDVLSVQAAGNSGNGGAPAGLPPVTQGILAYPADHFNGLSVGALNAGNTTVASFSAYLPLASGAAIPVQGGGTATDLGRNGVHLAAPGQNINTARSSGGFMQMNGTSFAAPHVAGAVGVLWSAGRQAIEGDGRTDKGAMFSTDHRLLKAVLINSATKIAGRSATGAAQGQWTPGQVDPGNANRWFHPLNYSVGAGALNLNEAWLQYREQASSITNNTFQNRWWAESTAETGVSVNYRTSVTQYFELPDGFWISGMTATLTWDRHMTTAQLESGVATSLSNLDLLFQYSTDSGTSWQDIIVSVSPNDSTEHVHIRNLASYGDDVEYRLRVQNSGLASGVDVEGFAIAARYFAKTIPTPGGTTLLCIAALVVARRRR